MSEPKSLKELLKEVDIENHAVLEVDEPEESEQKRIVQRKETKEANYVKIAYLYMKGFSIQEIADIMGISSRAVKEIRSKEEFKSVIRTISAEVISAGRMFLSASGIKAVKTMIDLLDSPNDKIRLNASKEILNRIGLKSPEQLEIINKSNDIRNMSTEELTKLVEIGAKEIMPKTNINENK